MPCRDQKIVARMVSAQDMHFGKVRHGAAPPLGGQDEPSNPRPTAQVIYLTCDATRRRDKIAISQGACQGLTHRR